MRQVLQDGFLRALKPPATGRIEMADLRCAGLVLRVTSAGVKSWSFRFRDPTTGKTARATIGAYPTITLSAARSRAEQMRREVAGGDNPALRKRQDRAGGEAKTFGHLAARYIAEHARRRKRSHAADDRNLRLHLLPKWKSRAFDSIRRADVIELVEGLIAAGKGTLANRVQSLISAIFTFGMDASLLEYNPCHRLRKRGVERAGRRVLSDDEMRLFWHGIELPVAAQRTGLGLRLALLTGARVGEIAGLSRAELEHLADPARAAWIIPGERTKNKRAHLIPLTSRARGIVLDLLEMIGPGEQFLFPARTRRRQGPMRSNSLTQAMDYFGKRLHGDTDAERTWRAEPPTPHDLRRTLATRLAELKVPKEIRDRVLNHIPQDVSSKHYTLYDFTDEKREALNRWSLNLAAIVQTPSVSVVSIAARRQGGNQ